MELDVREHFEKPAMRFYSDLSTEDQRKLTEQLESFDAEHCLRSLKEAMLCRERKRDHPEHYEPIDPRRCRSMSSMHDMEKSHLYQLGIDAISAGQVAVVLLSGGQGTRLGTAAPKGTYDIGLPSGKSLFQLQAERILKLQSLAVNNKRNKLVPHILWCIMDSESTESATVTFFKNHNYFGLSKSQVIFFCQDVMPCFGLDGKVLLDSRSHIAVAPNGNGGLYESLSSQRVLDRLSDYGIRYVHVYCVDNVLVRVADPWFIGFCKIMDADCAVKTVERVDPNEPLGVVCKRDGLPVVVEYTELTQPLVNQRDQNGKLLFRAGNIANHVFTLDFLQHLTKENRQLPYHLALKKIVHVNDDGAVVVPNEPNGLKLERFVFDVFPFSRNIGVLEVVREDEFSPLKNADTTGVDCPTTCRQDLYRLHNRWLQEAGANLPKTVEPICEVSPLVSYAGEGLDIVNHKDLQYPVRLELPDEVTSC